MTKAQRDWGQFVLLLIDVQRDFWSERVAEGFPDFPTNIARLLAFCRSEGIEVVHLRASFKPDMSDWMPTYKLRGRIPCVQGTAGVETVPFALDKPGEKVIVKQTFDGFHNPELLRYLCQNGKRFVLTAGLVTSVCVFLTTASAMQKGFLAAIIEDCCAGHPQMHEQTLETYQFMFQRTTLDLIPERHPEWLAALKQLDE
jgi:nicotinamidase-related amidase